MEENRKQVQPEQRLDLKFALKYAMPRTAKTADQIQILGKFGEMYREDEEYFNDLRDNSLVAEMQNLREFKCDRHYCNFNAFIGLKHLKSITIME